MAYSPARTGVDSARLRRALVRITTHRRVRRLLVVAGLALAGWLLSAAPQASAQPLPHPIGDTAHKVSATHPLNATQLVGAARSVDAARPASAVRPMDAARPLGAPHSVSAHRQLHAARRLGAVAGVGAARGVAGPVGGVRRVCAAGGASGIARVYDSPRVVGGGHGLGALVRRRAGGPGASSLPSEVLPVGRASEVVRGTRALVRGVLTASPGLPIRRAAVSGLPPQIEHAGSSVSPAGSPVREADGDTWAPRHRGGAVAGHGGRPVAVAISGAPKVQRAGDRRVGSRAADTYPDLPTDSQPPLTPKGDALLPAAGPGLTGAAGHADCAGAQERPWPMLVPPAGTVPPAVRTAADEPSFAPD